MDPLVVDKLMAIRKKHPSEHGKIMQKLLGMAFCRNGYTMLFEHSVEGVDLDMQKNGERLAVEVKTTQSVSEVSVAPKDEEGLRTAETAGAKPVLAALSVNPLAEGWILADARGLRSGNTKLYDLERKRLGELEPNINQAFFDVILQHGPALIGASRGHGQEVAERILSRECKRPSL